VKGNLKKITDITIQDLLQHEIILPSIYFESFDKNAKKLSVDINDAKFENEISNLLIDELKNINNYMKKTVDNIDLLSEATNDAQQAIKNKDEKKLKIINSSIGELKNEINALKHLIYLDPLTKTYNRRWIYNHVLDKEGMFKNNGLLVFINLTDCDYLAEKYGNQLADNVILYITKFINEQCRNENLHFNIARYSDHQFVLFITQETTENIIPFIKNVRRELANTTLKSKSGLMFKTSFNFGLRPYQETENFQDTLERTAELSMQEKETNQ